MDIDYKINTPISTQQFIDVLHTSTLSERRPVNNYECMQGMVQNSNLMVTAWHNNALIGIARSMTDFHYACYVSDLAVHKNYQSMGIGKQLLALTQAQLGPLAKLILIAAPAANSYYQHIGFTHNTRCWVLDNEQNRATNLGANT